MTDDGGVTRRCHRLARPVLPMARTTCVASKWQWGRWGGALFFGVASRHRSSMIASKSDGRQPAMIANRDCAAHIMWIRYYDQNHHASTPLPWKNIQITMFREGAAPADTSTIYSRETSRHRRRLKYDVFGYCLLLLRMMPMVSALAASLSSYTQQPTSSNLEKITGILFGGEWDDVIFIPFHNRTRTQNLVHNSQYPNEFFLGDSGFWCSCSWWMRANTK
jgi:hypothetical protein